MSTNYLKKSVLALMAALTISANSSQAGEGTATNGEGSPPRPFQNLVSDDAALEAWNHVGGKQVEIDCKGSTALPLTEFAPRIARLFTNQFDLILPTDPDPSMITVQLQLKNVRAIEIFNAMNLYFETDKIPARWKLTLNGDRPTALLEMAKPIGFAEPPVEPDRKATVFSIADYLYASTPSALYKQSATNLLEALQAVFDDISGRPGRGPQGGIRADAPVIKIHAEVGILVFTGTAEQTALVHSTLEALTDARHRKADVLDREQKANLKEAR